MLTHVWGLMAHPNREWKQIQSERETVTHLYAHHVLEVAAIPVICAFIGTTQVGWSLTGSDPIVLTPWDALGAGVAFYVIILAAVALMGGVIYKLAQRYPSRPSLRCCIIFAGYVATPMFLSGIVALYPLVWLCLLAGTIGLCYSAYLLYLGTPAFLQISRAEASSVTGATLGVGVLVLEALLAVTVLVWGYGARWLFGML
ncbi:Yip1 family protein [Halomonas shantousis]